MTILMTFDRNLSAGQEAYSVPREKPKRRCRDGAWGMRKRGPEGQMAVSR